MKRYVDVYEPISSRWFSYFLQDLDELIQTINFWIGCPAFTYNTLCRMVGLNPIQDGDHQILQKSVKLTTCTMNNGTEQYYVLSFS